MKTKHRCEGGEKRNVTTGHFLSVKHKFSGLKNIHTIDILSFASKLRICGQIVGQEKTLVIMTHIVDNWCKRKMQGEEQG